MSTTLVALIGLVYLGVAIDQLLKGAVGPAIMFLGYAIGNAGILMVVKWNFYNGLLDGTGHV